MATDHMLHQIYMECSYATFYMLDNAVFSRILQSIKILHSFNYECAQGFVLHIPTLTVLLGPISMHDPTHIMLYWAACNYNNAYGCGDIEQNNIQTWRLS